MVFLGITPKPVDPPLPPLQSCKNVPTVPTSWCYFFWPVLIFGKNTRKQAKTRENRRKTGAFLVLIFWGGKLVSANFYAFCNYGITLVVAIKLVLRLRTRILKQLCADFTKKSLKHVIVGLVAEENMTILTASLCCIYTYANVS